jgi:hypothetical protein
VEKKEITASFPFDFFFFELRNEGKSEERLWKSMENVLWFYNKPSGTDLLCVWELICTL